MILAAGVHVYAAAVLVLRQWAARPVGYQRRQSRAFAYAARTMKYTGPLVLAFVFFHLAHFTWGWQVTPAPFIEGDVYANVAASFQHAWVALVYVVGVLPGGVSPDPRRAQHVRVAGAAASALRRADSHGGGRA